MLASIFLYITHYVSAQKSSELGLFLGGASYFGEINSQRELYAPSFDLGAIYRRSYNPHYSLKGMISLSELSGNDKDFSKSSDYQDLRNRSVDDNTIIDLLFQLEYNFYPISYSKNKDNFTPYAHIGAGAFLAFGSSPMLQASLPFGAGIKMKLNEKWEMRLEYIFHKTFTDKLDNIPYYTDTGDYKYKQLSEKSNNDNFSVYGISLLYTVKRQQMQCPVFDKH